MKNFIILLVLAVTFLSSCEKEVTPIPATTTSVTPHAIQVEYAIYSASSDVEVVYLIELNGRLVERTMNVNRVNETISFSTDSHQEIMVKARNNNPSHKEVMVSIYVNGLLFKSNSTTGMNEWAIASGTPQ